MADVQPVPLQDFGALQNSFPLGQAQIAATNAGAALTQAQAQGALIGNQQAQTQLQLLRQGIAGLSNFSGQAPAQHSDQSGADPDDTSVFAGDGAAGLDAGLRQRFWVNPMGTPQQQQAIVMAHLSGNKGLADAMTAQRDMSVAQQTAIAQRESSTMFDAMQAVQSAPPGQAMQAFEAVMPRESKIVQAEIDEGVDPDEAARDTAAHVAASVHQYTGREIAADTGGQYRDVKTGQPIANVVAGMNAQQTAALRAEALKLVDVPQSDGSSKQEPTWQAQHFPSAGAWVSTMAARLVSTQSMQATGATGAPAAAPGVAPSAPASGGPAPAGRPRSAIPPAGQAPGAAPTAPAVDPVLKQALGDPAFRLANTLAKPVAGQTPSATQKAALEDVGKAQSDLYKDAQTATAAAGSSLQFLGAAKAIMDSKGATLGAYGGLVSQASRWLPFGNTDATNYQEVAKYLGNAALAQAKQVFGNKMTQMEVKLQLQELSPSTKMTDTAVNNLLNTNIRNAQYAIASGRRVGTYLTAGNDPRQFDVWNQQYFPKEKAVNAPPAGNTPPNSNAGATTPTTPAAARPDAAGFIQGRLYPGANGTKARYMGAGQWQQQ